MIKKALNRISWRMQNSWKSNQNDIDAYNQIVDFVNNTNKINDYQLFAKLYIWVYGQLLIHYNATVFDKEPQKELHRILDKPLTQIIEEFTNKLNQTELYQLLQDKGISTKPHGEKDKVLELDQYPEWKTEDVKNNLETMINRAINQFS